MFTSGRVATHSDADADQHGNVNAYSDEDAVCDAHANQHAYRYSHADQHAYQDSYTVEDSNQYPNTYYYAGYDTDTDRHTVYSGACVDQHTNHAGCYACIIR